MNKAWTEAERTQLKMLVDQRKTDKEIGGILGRTHRGISAAKVKYGIYKPPLLSPDNPLHLATVIKFKMAGWTLSEIAEIYGCTPQHVSRVLVQNGMVGFMRNRPNPQYLYAVWTELEIHRLRKLCRKRESLDRICPHFPRRSREAIEIRIRNLTRYWFTPEEQAERKRLRKKEMELRVY